MNKVFTSNGWEDYIYWQTEDKKTLKKINTLLKDIDDKRARILYGSALFDTANYDDEYEYEEDDEEGTITIYGNPKSYAAIQKHLEECGFEDVGGDFTYIPNDLKEVTPEQRETLDKMIERLEEFDDVQTVYTNMQPEEGEEE